MKTLLVLVFTFLTGTSAKAQSPDQTEAHRIGAMVIAIDAALKAPDALQSLETIAACGNDSRHYVMIRGWMVELLKGTESQLSAANDPDLKRKHQSKVDFLKKVIRRIDLE